MSYFDDASLAFLPSGAAGKDGKAYSIKPTDGTGDFTFSRGSNLAATRVGPGPNYYIEKGRENLLLQSNQFDTTPWGGVNASVTPNATTAPDGTLTASKIVATGGNAQHRIDQGTTSSAGVKTFSVYLKQSEITTSWLRIGTSGCFIDLTNGAISSISSGIIASTEALANDWYRCSITKTNAAANEILRINAGVTDYLGDNISGIFVWSSQYEEGLAATEVIESGATKGKAGLLENEPRFDYSGGATCPSLLLEPSRTNNIPYSEYLSGLSLNNSPTLTQNYAVSPEGVQNAVRIQDTDGSSFKTIQTQFSVTANSTYTISVYVKKATSPISTYGGFYFDFDGGTRKTSNLIFDEYNGTLVNASGNAITSVINPVINEGDYWRFSATATDTGSNTILRATLRPGASTNGTSIGYAIKDYTAYGFQAEQGSYVSSYIPNHSGGTITRAADSQFDILSLLSKGIISSATEWTIFFDLEGVTDEFNVGDSRFFTGQDSTLDVYLRPANTLQQYARFYWRKDAKYIGSSYGKKIIARLTAGTGTTFVDGTLNGSSSISGDYSLLGFGINSTVSGYVNKIIFFPTALTDADCIALTT